MSDYRLLVKVKNNNILKAIENAGYKTVGGFCAANNIQPSEVGELVNMKVKPILKDGSWRASAIRLSDVLLVSLDDLFTEVQKGLQLKRNQAEKVYTETQMQELTNDGPDMLLLQRESKDILDRVIGETLTPREVDVITRRYGVGGCRKQTHREIGESWGAIGYGDNVTASRIRQIEERALRRLRHPDNSSLLREVLDLDA